MPIVPRLLAAALALATIGAAPGQAPGAYTRVEGRNTNVFVRDGAVAAHVVLRAGTEPRLIVAFPAGNSGVGLWFEKTARPVAWRITAPPRPVTLADARGRPLHGVRFTVAIDAPRLVVRQGLLSSIRVLRDYQALGTAPAAVTVAPSDDATTLDWRRDRLDGAAGYRLTVRVVGGRVAGRTIEGGRGGIVLEVTALTGEPPLTPLDGPSLLNARAGDDVVARHALAFLSYREKLLAGSWRFDTYFGRDTLMSVRLLMPALQPQAIESGLGSVLARLSAGGNVAHEEDIGEFAILDHLKRDGTRSAEPTYDYEMIDGDFLLAPVARAWLVDDARGRAHAAAFLAAAAGDARNGDRVVRNLRFVADRAAAFAERPVVANLIGLKPGSTVGEWRDSNDGLGGGRYPYDVNAVLVPAALDAAQALVASGLLDRYLNDADRARFAGLAQAAAMWRDQAPGLFRRRVEASDAARAIADYARTAGVPAAPALAALGGGALTYHAIALDGDGGAVPIQSSDEGFALLFAAPPADALDIAAETIARPFPAGLMTGAGMVVANPVLAPPALQAKFGPTAYHGTVIWSWQQALAAAGLARQLARADLPPATRAKLAVAHACLWQAIDATRSVGSSELWSWRYADGRYRVAPFGASGADADESNAAQLWSTVFLALPHPAPGGRCPAR